MRCLTALPLTAFFATTALAVDFEYTVTNLGSFGGPASEAYAINDAGQVVGYAYTAGSYYGSPQRHAFFYSDGVMSIMGTPGETDAVAFDINSSGQATGYTTIPNGVNTVEVRAFVYQNGSIETLPSSAQYSAYGYAINASGEVAGCMDNQAAVFSGGGSLNLGTLGGSQSFAFAINSSGQVVGYSTLAGDNEAAAFIYTPGAGMQNLGTLAGATSNYMPIWASDINDAGQVIGIAVNQENQTRHGFLYSNGQLEDLGSFDASEMLDPRAINSAGDIVGNCSTTFAPTHTFLRTQGALLDLNELLVSTDSTWRVISANDINDFGQIAATAEDPQKGRCAVVLSPVPIVTVEGPSEVATLATSRMIKGRSSGHALKIFCRVGNGRLKPAAGTSSWRFRGKLRPGRNVITVTAYGPFGHSEPKKVIVRRR